MVGLPAPANRDAGLFVDQGRVEAVLQLLEFGDDGISPGASSFPGGRPGLLDAPSLAANVFGAEDQPVLSGRDDGQLIPVDVGGATRVDDLDAVGTGDQPGMQAEPPAVDHRSGTEQHQEDGDERLIGTEPGDDGEHRDAEAGCDDEDPDHGEGRRGHAPDASGPDGHTWISSCPCLTDTAPLA